MNGGSPDVSESAARIEGIFHPVISVSAMDDAVRFYRDVLGLRVAFDDYHDSDAIARLFGFSEPSVHSVVMECEDRSEFELVEFERPRGSSSTDKKMSDAGIAALALRVSGIEKLIDRVRLGGFAMSSELVAQTLPDGAVLKVAVCRGPDGVTVIFVEPPPGRRSLGGEL